MKEGTFISGGQEWVLSVKKGQYHIGYYGDDSTFEFMCPTETMRDYFQKLSTFIHITGSKDEFIEAASKVATIIYK